MQRFYLSTVVPVYKNSLVHIVYTLTCIYETNFNLENELRTDTDADSLSDESFIETMEKHRRLENGKFECRMSHSSGIKQWAVEDLVEKDMPGLVKEHKIKNSLEANGEEMVHAIPTSPSEKTDVEIEGEDDTGLCLTPLKKKRTGN